MNNLNSILIEGNLVEDAMLSNTEAGSVICSFTIASNRYYKSGDGMEKEVGFFNIESWGRLAEVCHEHGYKGRGAKIVGRLKQSRWRVAKGQSHSRIFIVAEHIEFRPDSVKQRDEPRKEAVAECA